MWNSIRLRKKVKEKGKSEDKKHKTLAKHSVTSSPKQFFPDLQPKDEKVYSFPLRVSHPTVVGKASSAGYHSPITISTPSSESGNSFSFSSPSSHAKSRRREMVASPPEVSE